MEQESQKRGEHLACADIENCTIQTKPNISHTDLEKVYILAQVLLGVLKNEHENIRTRQFSKMFTKQLNSYHFLRKHASKLKE